MKKNKKDSRKEELRIAVRAIYDFLECTINKHELTVGETFAVMNVAYANLLDDVLKQDHEGLSNDELKIYLKTRVYQLLDVLDNNIPIKEDKDE